MKGKVAMLAILVIVLMSLCAVAHAEGPKATKMPENYFVFKPGAFFPTGDIKDLKTGFNGEIAYGRRFHPNAALEIASGYIGPGNNTKTGTVTGSYGTVYGYSTKSELYAIPITLAIKGIACVDNFEIFAVLGGGGYYVNAKETYTVNGLGRVSASDSTWVLGGFLGAGATYNITPEWFIGLEGKYLWTDKAKLRDTIGTVTLTGDVRVEGVQGLALIGFRF
jgi:opacity protein-like surface antigen